MLYETAEWEALKAHMERYYGSIEQMFPAPEGLAIPVEVAVIGPKERQPYRILMTVGLGAYLMNVPEQLKDYGLERAELLICLPEDMQVTEETWPVKWLQQTAQLAESRRDWLGWGYSAEAPEVAGRFDGLMLMLPDDFGPKAATCRIKEHTDVHYYQMIPLYPTERAFRESHDANSLIDQFDGDFSPVVDMTRKVYC